MKTIYLLLLISSFLLEKASSFHEPSEIKYGEWRPHYPSEVDDSTGYIYANGPRACSDCVKGPAVFPVAAYKNHLSYLRHRKRNLRIDNSGVFQIPDVQANRIPYWPSPWMLHKPTLPEALAIPGRAILGSVPATAVRAHKPKICARKSLSKVWIPPIIPEPESAPTNIMVCECGISTSEHLIISGEKVQPPFKYPWMVAIQSRDGRTFCGGAIISELYILTAAHCFVKSTTDTTEFFKPSQVQVAFVTDTNLVSEGEEVAKIIPHPNYEYANKDHDIALLKLKKQIQCSIERRRICLPPPGILPHIGQQFVIAGWGSRIGGESDISPNLMQAAAILIDFNQCSAKFSTLRENFHCLHGVKNSTPCHGDSGGPLFVQHEHKFYVFGVASMHNSKVCDTNDVFVYTKVTNYLDWIKSVMSH